MKIKMTFLFLTIISLSCAVNPRSNIESDELFMVDLNKTRDTRGFTDMGLNSLFWGAYQLAEKAAKPFTSSYSQSVSLNNYYTSYPDGVKKTYDKIVIRKFSHPHKEKVKQNLSTSINSDLENVPTTRGNTTILNPELNLNEELTLSERTIFRDSKDDINNFYAVIEIESDPKNPGVSRLNLLDLRIFFSRTKLYQKNKLNAVVSVSVEGQWLDPEGSPKKQTLIEQEYNLLDLHYGSENQITRPITSHWYYDIPIPENYPELQEFGVARINVQLKEYDSGKRNYVKKLPDILSVNKHSIIREGQWVIQQIVK